MPLDFRLSAPPVMSRVTLDRAAELRHNEAALEAGWGSALVLEIDRAGRFPTSSGPAGRTLAFRAARDIAERPPYEAVFLGRDVQGRHVWGISVAEIGDTAGSPDTRTLRTVGAELIDGDAAIVAEALALFNWHDAAIRDRTPDLHQTRTLAGWAGIDPFHSDVEFPRTDPAIICLVHDGLRSVLLGRGVAWPERRFSTLAGFVEAGESLESCVIREVREEVGVTVRNVRYLGSQPWPFPRSLMVGFHARADPEEPIHPEPGEIAEARWFDVDEIRAAIRGEGSLLLPDRLSIARGIIESWAEAVEVEDPRLAPERP